MKLQYLFIICNDGKIRNVTAKNTEFSWMGGQGNRTLKIDAMDVDYYFHGRFCFL